VSLLTNLISYWKLDEASGTRVDSHGTNDLTDNGSVGSGTGIINSAADFESSTPQYLSHSDNSDLSTGDIDFTFACWLKPESVAGNMVIAGKSTAASGGEEWILRYNLLADRFRLTVQGGSTYTEIDANSFGFPVVGSWHFVVIWHDSVNNLVGISVNAGTPDTASHTAGVNDGSGPFQIGKYPNDPSQYWDGLVDEAGFWKRVLTSQERTDLYNSGSGLAYSAFGGGGGTDGTATVSTATTTWAATSPALTGSATVLPASLDALWQVRTATGTGTAVITQGSSVSATWAVQASSASSGNSASPSECTVTWACNSAVAVGSATCLPPANSLTFSVQSPALTANASLTTSTLNITWASQAPVVTGEQNLLTAGTISSSGHTDTTAALSCTAAVNGTTPYAYQWYRSTSSGFTPGAGNILSGKTSLTLADTGLTASTNYYYVLKVTDNDSTVAYATEFNVLTDSAPGVGGVGSFRATTGAGI